MHLSIYLLDLYFHFTYSNKKKHPLSYLIIVITGHKSTTCVFFFLLIHLCKERRV